MSEPKEYDEEENFNDFDDEEVPKRKTGVDENDHGEDDDD